MMTNGLYDTPLLIDIASRMTRSHMKGIHNEKAQDDQSVVATDMLLTRKQPGLGPTPLSHKCQ
jgi:hypothetical protein